MNAAPAIITHRVTKRYAGVAALHDVSLTVPTGAVYGLLGRNGAGKSTLLQLLLGQQCPSEGRVEVLGRDPATAPPAHRGRIGYIPERLPLYDWMTVGEALRFTQPFYPQWDAALAEQMVRQFDLPLRRRLSKLSRGMRAQLNLVLSLAYRPELLLLDECTSGLDVVVRREFTDRIIEAASETGRTVLFATHQVLELERLCDWVGVLEGGRLLTQEPLEQLQGRVKRLHLWGAEGDGLRERTAVLDVQRCGRELVVTVGDYSEATAAFYAAQASEIEVADLRLDEILVAVIGRGGRDETLGSGSVLERVA